MGKMFFNILATFAEFEVDLLRMRTREGMAIARAKGRLKGRQPTLTAKQQKELRRMHDTATTPSPTSPNSSKSPDPPSTEPSNANPTTPSRDDTNARLYLVTRSLPTPHLARTAR